MGRSPITLCGSISHHPGPLGSRLHGAGYHALGLDFVYVPFGVDDLEGAIRGMRALGIRGLGVSMPFKVEVIRYLDRIEPLAERIGAVNTVVNDAGVLTGYNADAAGAVAALEEVTPLEGQRALILGAGGAARAVAHGLSERGARLKIVARRAEAAQLIAEPLGAGWGALDALHDMEGQGLVINCTPVGMADSPGTVVPEAWLRPDQVVMDIVYKPIETALVAAARRRGARVVHGGRMLLHQAYRQFELYTGRPAPRQAMAEALDAYLGG